MKKFLFDQHNFDDDFEDEAEPEATLPPPPTFSEEELGAAKQQGYEQGRQEALAEAAASHEKSVADQLGKIAQKFDQLFEFEAERSALYETEAVHLAATIFEALFPSLNNKTGLDEIRTLLADVIASQKDQPAIQIEVAPQFVPAMESYLPDLVIKLRCSASCKIQGNERLSPGDCRMSWESGGAVRDTAALADKIKKELEQALADKARLSDNEKPIQPRGDKS